LWLTVLAGGGKASAVAGLGFSHPRFEWGRSVSFR
jgi:hypothetical protein